MSATYLVRMAKDKELLGVFWADNIDELAIVIDCEIVDPALCEIKKIKNGGFYWGPIDVKCPVGSLDYESFEDEDPIGDAIQKLPVPSISWNFIDDLLSDKGWRSIKDIWNGKSAYDY